MQEYAAPSASSAAVQQAPAPATPGRTTLAQGDGGTEAAAAHGTSGTAGALPFGESIQRSFGRHDVSHVRAHQGPEAAAGAQAMGARAFATGDHVAFGGAPDLHTAAHEAAHVVQQRGGVHLAGGVGAAGDAHEQHADAVADAVVRGDSAEPLLNRYASGGGSGGGTASRGVQKKPELDPTRGAPFYRDSVIKTLSLKSLAAFKATDPAQFQIRNLLQTLHWKPDTENDYFTDAGYTNKFDLGAHGKGAQHAQWNETLDEVRKEHSELDQRVGVDLDADEAARRKEALSMYLLQSFLVNALYRVDELSLLEYQGSPLNYQEENAYLRSFATSYVKGLQAVVAKDYVPGRLLPVRDKTFRGSLDKFFEVARFDGVSDPTAPELEAELSQTIDRAAQFALKSTTGDLGNYWDSAKNPQAFVDLTGKLDGLSAAMQQSETARIGAFVQRSFAKGVAKKLAKKEEAKQVKGADFGDDIGAALETHVDHAEAIGATRKDWDLQSNKKGAVENAAFAQKVFAAGESVAMKDFLLTLPARTKPQLAYIKAITEARDDAAKLELAKFLKDGTKDIPALYARFLDWKLQDKKRSDFSSQDKFDTYEVLRKKIETVMATSRTAVCTGGVISIAGANGTNMDAVLLDSPDMAMAVKMGINKSGSVPSPMDATRKLLKEQSLDQIVLGVIAKQNNGSGVLKDAFTTTTTRIRAFAPNTYTSLAPAKDQLLQTKEQFRLMKEAVEHKLDTDTLEMRAAVKLIEGSEAVGDNSQLPAFVLAQLQQHMAAAMENKARVADHMRSIMHIHEVVILSLELHKKDHDKDYQYLAPQHDSGSGKDDFYKGTHLTDYGLKAFSQAYDAAQAQAQARGQDTFDVEAFYNIYFELTDKLKSTKKSRKDDKFKMESPSSVEEYLQTTRFKDISVKGGPDVVFVDIHPNDASRAKIASHDVIELMAKIFEKAERLPNYRLTMMVDITLNHTSEDEVANIRKAAEPFIASGKLNLVFLQSLAKFAQLGSDKSPGGIVFAYNKGDDWEKFNEHLAEARARDTVDPTIHKFFQALFQHAAEEQKEYLVAIRAKTKLMHEKLLAGFAKLDVVEPAIEIAENTDKGTCYVAMRHEEFTAKIFKTVVPSFETVAKYNHDILKHCIDKILHQCNLPVAMRESFGFPISNLGDTGKEIRFTIGIEDEALLQSYADVLSYVSGSLAKKYEAIPIGVDGKDTTMFTDEKERATLIKDLVTPITSLAELELKLKGLRK